MSTKRFTLSLSEEQVLGLNAVLENASSGIVDHFDSFDERVGSELLADIELQLDNATKIIFESRGGAK